jgi:ABC-type transport system involved in multi-copper enzyme maturation permease subunit
VTQARVIRSEWTKFTSLRSTVWSLLATVVITVGLGALFSAAVMAHWDQADDTDKLTFDATFQSISGIYLAQLAIGVLGVLIITGEFSTGMIRASLGAVPRRLPVLWGKVAVFGAVAFGLGLASVVAAFGAGQAVLKSKHIDASLTDPGVLRALLGAAFYLTVVGLLGLALGTLLRSTAGAIASLFGLVLVLPILASLLPENMRDIGKYLPSGAGEAMIRVVVHNTDVISPGGGFVVLCGYAVAALAAGAYVLVRRDA